MQLHAVIVPPPGVVQAALEAARDLVPPPPAPPEVPKRGFMDWLLDRSQPEPVVLPAARLVSAAPETVLLRVAKFGNLTAPDAAALAESLAAAAATWPSPVVRVGKVSVAKDDPFDVTAQLEGDLDALRAIHRNVNEVAEQHRLYLDRRSFRGELALGSIEMEDGSPVPDQIAGSDVALRGERWSPDHVTLLRSSFAGGGTVLAEYAQIDLAVQGTEELGALG
jgi:2'-5' RNA ligase